MPCATSAGERPERADVRRNRRKILDAAVELVLETGGEPSRDSVAQRAGVGIATLYRHFPDQQRLLGAVAIDVLERTIAAGRAALDEAGSGGEALRRYLHAAVDTGLGAVNIVHPLIDVADWPEHRAAAHEVLGRLVEAARRDGALGHEIDEAEIALAAIRFCRPLAIGLDPAAERRTAHRHLDTYLDGLAAAAHRRR